MPNYPNIHAIVYGQSGNGKSTFAATFPKPMIVFNFDAYGKDVVYRRKGIARPPVQDSDGVVRQEIIHPPTGESIITIEHYHDENPEQPTAYERFMRRMSYFNADERASYRTVVLDSVTSMELAARKQQQYKINPRSKEPRQWYAGSTERLEEMLCSRFGALYDVNVLVLAHVDEDKDELHGTFVRTPSAPGRLRTRLAAYYNEMYRCFAVREAAGVVGGGGGGRGGLTYRLQTRADAMYNAYSMEAGAPDPCEPRYSALWSTYEVPETLNENTTTTMQVEETTTNG